MRIRGRTLYALAATAALVITLAATSAAADAHKIKLVDADGKTVLTLKAKDGDYKLADGSDNAIGKVRVKDDRVKLKDAAGTAQWTIKRKGPKKVEVENAAGDRLYLIKKTDNGSWKVTDKNGAFVVKLKPKDGGVTLKDSSGKKTGKVKVDGDQLKIKNASGETRLKVKGFKDGGAGAWFAVDQFEPAQRAALAIYFHKVHR